MTSNLGLNANCFVMPLNCLCVFFLPICSRDPVYPWFDCVNLVLVCRVYCPYFPMHLSPSLCCLSLSGLNHHVHLSKLFVVWITPLFWI